MSLDQKVFLLILIPIVLVGCQTVYQPLTNYTFNGDEIYAGKNDGDICFSRKYQTEVMKDRFTWGEFVETTPPGVNKTLLFNQSVNGI